MEKNQKPAWIQKTLCLVKPDGVRRSLVGKILTRFEEAGFRLCALKMIHPDQNLAEQHYLFEDIGQRHGKDVWLRLINFLTSGPVVAFVLEGVHSISAVRKLCGGTEPASAQPGTIRGDFSHQSYEASNGAQSSIRNVIHASSCEEDAAREISLWFKAEEILDYSTNDEREHYLNLSPSQRAQSSTFD